MQSIKKLEKKIIKTCKWSQIATKIFILINLKKKQFMDHIRNKNTDKYVANTIANQERKKYGIQKYTPKYKQKPTKCYNEKN